MEHQLYEIKILPVSQGNVYWIEYTPTNTTTDKITVTTSVAQDIAVYTSPTGCGDLIERACQTNTTEISDILFPAGEKIFFAVGAGNNI